MDGKRDSLNDLLLRYTDLEIKKRENRRVLEGIDLNIKAVSQKAEDLARRGGLLATMDNEIAVLKHDLSLRGAGRLAWGERRQYKKLLESAEIRKIRALAELREVHGVGQEAIIDKTAKLTNQVKKAKQGKKLIDAPDKAESEQKKIEHEVDGRIRSGERGENLILPRWFSKERELNRRDRSAARVAERRFQEIAGAETRSYLNAKCFGLIPSGKTAGQFKDDGKRNWNRFIDSLSQKGVGFKAQFVADRELKGTENIKSDIFAQKDKNLLDSRIQSELYRRDEWKKMAENLAQEDFKRHMMETASSVSPKNIRAAIPKAQAESGKIKRIEIEKPSMLNEKVRRGQSSSSQNHPEDNRMDEREKKEKHYRSR